MVIIVVCSLSGIYFSDAHLTLVRKGEGDKVRDGMEGWRDGGMEGYQK
jgi:hypothetical protein